VPLAAARARLGLQLSVHDFVDEVIDLHRHLLVRNPVAPLLYRAGCRSMSGAGISDGDGNQPAGTLLQLFESHMELHSANPDFPPIVLEHPTEVEVFAVVGVVR